EKTKAIIRLSLVRLFLQLNVPLLYIGIPCIMAFIQAGTHIFPFLLVVYVIHILPLHPIAHNSVLLFLMPTYRRAITKFFKSSSITPNNKLNLWLLTMRGLMYL
ncbi:hypothetical protein PMAYCL1PPCAC_09267, partial [Pristionchus mayeri]